MKLIFILLFFTFSCTQLDRTPSSISSVLVVGDSQTEGHLGKIFFGHLQASSEVNKFKVVGVGSSSPRHWGDKLPSKHAKWLCTRKGRVNDKSRVSMDKTVCQRDKTQSAFGFLNSPKPDLVVFQFLGNSMGFSESFISQKVGNLLADLSDDQQCVFVTSPPFYKDLVERNMLRLQTQGFIVKAIGSRCKVVAGVTEHTLKNFAYRRDFYVSDRIHLSKKGASEFFKMIAPHLP